MTVTFVAGPGSAIPFQLQRFRNEGEKMRKGGKKLATTRHSLKGRRTSVPGGNDKTDL